jgi:hypothetical protein
VPIGDVGIYKTYSHRGLSNPATPADAAALLSGCAGLTIARASIEDHSFNLSNIMHQLVGRFLGRVMGNRPFSHGNPTVDSVGHSLRL